MNSIPVLGFSAYSGSGKTTLIEKLIPTLKQQGLRIAVIKHDGHSFEIDREGKDSRRFTRAGAAISAIVSSEKTAVIASKELALDDLLPKIRDVDLLLIEGYKQAAIPQIGIARKENGKGFPKDPSQYLAVVTDLELPAKVPCFGFEDIPQITSFIMEWLKMQKASDFTHFNDEGRAKMVDVGEKPISRRTATAAARVLVSPQT